MVRNAQVQAAVQRLWPTDQDPQTTARNLLLRSGANFLLQQEGYQALLSVAAVTFVTMYGSLESLGLPAKSFKSTLQGTSDFVVFGTKGSGFELVALDTTELLQLALVKDVTSAVPPPIPQPPQPVLQQPQPVMEPSQAGAISDQSLPPVTQLLFELQLQQDGSGWLQPSFILHPQQLQQAATDQPLQLFGEQQEQIATEAVAGGCQQLVGVKGSQPVLQEWGSNSSSSSSNGSSSGSSYRSYDDGGATAAADVTAAPMGGTARGEDSAAQQQEELATAANADGQGEGVSGDGDLQQPCTVVGCGSSNSTGLASDVSSCEEGLAVGGGQCQQSAVSGCKGQPACHRSPAGVGWQQQ